MLRSTASAIVRLESRLTRATLSSVLCSLAGLLLVAVPQNGILHKFHSYSFSYSGQYWFLIRLPAVTVALIVAFFMLLLLRAILFRAIQYTDIDQSAINSITGFFAIALISFISIVDPATLRPWPLPLARSFYGAILLLIVSSTLVRTSSTPEKNLG
jgi:hypothetical protein